MGNRTSSPVTGNKSNVARLDFCNIASVIGQMRAIGVGHGVDNRGERKWWKMLL